MWKADHITYMGATSVLCFWNREKRCRRVLNLIDLSLLWVINLVDVLIWTCIKMPGKHAVEFSCSLILIVCCPHCVRSYLKITYKSITALSILKHPEASCILKVHLYFQCWEWYYQVLSNQIIGLLWILIRTEAQNHYSVDFFCIPVIPKESKLLKTDFGNGKQLKLPLSVIFFCFYKL